jgi:probable rRNA maturation factor
MPQGRLVIGVQIETPEWRSAWPRLAADTRALLKATNVSLLSASPLRGEGLSVDVVFASDARLRALNARFRGKNRPTNVLSFENPEMPLGGIALAFETISREAKAQRKPFINHSKHLILHGFLHLAGYDHHTARSARLMERLEIAILAAMGIPNPYLITRAKTRA